LACDQANSGNQPDILGFLKTSTMELIRGEYNLRPEHRGCVATIGNFDGIHLGHQAILGQLAEKADALDLPTTVISFEPLPREYFSHGQSATRLARLREKVQALKRYSVDRLLLLHFNEAMAALTAEEFVQQILVDKLGIRHLVVGDDFRFGKGRDGDFDFLLDAGERHGFQVSNMVSFPSDGCRVSSTRIREALIQGDLTSAEQLLGRPYRLSGRVIHGNKLGRKIGFHTANMRFGNYNPQEPWPGVASLGVRPTIDENNTEYFLEVHLFDFDQLIYGRHLQVDFLHKLRDEEKYDTLEALTVQIHQDVKDARAYLEHRQTC
jgi:riboflavin kinase/FMN adenylyltransferase